MSRRHLPPSVLGLVLLLGACEQAPIEALPDTPLDTFPVSEVSGTLTGWDNGEAFFMLSPMFSEQYPELQPTQPVYKTTVAADGNFRLVLPEPAASDLAPLGCTASEPTTLLLVDALAASVENPSDVTTDVLGRYALIPASASSSRAAWLYAAEAYEVDATCRPDNNHNLRAIDLALEPGWNQVLLSYPDDGSEGGGLLESSAVPDAFTWLETQDYEAP